MLARSASPPFPLPKGWTKVVNAAVLHAIPVVSTAELPTPTFCSSADDLTLSSSGMNLSQFGLLLAAPSLGLSPAGDGRLCIGGRVHAYPVRQADASGQLQYGPGEIVALAANFPPGHQPLPGETWYYQLLCRDPQGPCGVSFNATNALGVL